jgi:hypothetical protein
MLLAVENGVAWRVNWSRIRSRWLEVLTDACPPVADRVSQFGVRGADVDSAGVGANMELTYAISTPARALRGGRAFRASLALR